MSKEKYVSVNNVANIEMKKEYRTRLEILLSFFRCARANKNIKTITVEGTGFLDDAELIIDLIEKELKRMNATEREEKFWDKLGLTEEEKTELSKALSQQTKEKIKKVLNIVSPSKIPSSIIIDGWHDAEKELPKENGLYLVTTKTKRFNPRGEDFFEYDVEICEYYCGNFEIACCEVIAWTECPQPYRK